MDEQFGSRRYACHGRGVRSASMIYSKTGNEWQLVELEVQITGTPSVQAQAAVTRVLGKPAARDERWVQWYGIAGVPSTFGEPMVVLNSDDDDGITVSVAYEPSETYD